MENVARKQVFESIWDSVCAESPLSCSGAARDLLENWIDLFQIEMVEYTQTDHSALFLVDMSSLGFLRLELNLFAISRIANSEEDDRNHRQTIKEVRRLAKSEGLLFMVVLDRDRVEDLPESILQADTVYLFRDDLERQFSSSVPKVALFDAIQKQFPLEGINPYNTQREARGGMFMGRENETYRLTEELDRNFLVTGARFLGKTSLLVRAHHILAQRKSTRQRTFLFNANSIRGIDAFSQAMARDIDPHRELRVHYPGHLISMFREKSRDGRSPLLLFFDECDGMLQTDAVQDWPILRQLQEARQEGYIRLVLAGYRSVDEVLSHIYCPLPLKRYFEIIDLPPLERKHARELIHAPFDGSRISILDSQTVHSRVWELTEGHPFLIQFLGEKIFRIARKRNPSSFSVDDIESCVGDDYEFHTFLMRYFLLNTEHNGKPVAAERLLAFLYVHKANGEPWNRGDFLKAADDAGYRQIFEKVESALGSLQKMKLFRYRDYRCTLGLPILGDFLRHSFQDIDVVLNIMAKDLQ